MKPVFVLLLSLAATPLAAADPEVLAAEARRAGEGWSFAVTLAHPDTGWEHYADGWRIEDEVGTALGTRVLAHPHETEQPFTRSLSGVAVPAGTARVYIRARCLIDGWSDTRLPLDLR
ncbi:hypothetical protein [Salipiger sp. PrR002]|uniref:hypothetical protein n=1 Tax=Salipiger sp. PrR002 TaxID=2706489 RepID=UPI0013BD5782|nr:hypothetical protein [Salipiger sp. PrR002]NDV98317.1 hypothetical protein [Salipiger sp. PrR002]NDW55029.1 hypothetical protein [Salipiger sp. PrR004]